MMNILDYIPFGKDNAISRERLVQLTGMTDRAVRKSIQELREDGEIILSSSHGKLQDCTPIRALGGMMAKHTVSVYDLIREHDEGSTVELAMWNEKIGDSINYLLLLKALVVEHMEEERKAMRVGVCDGASQSVDF